MKRLIAFLPVFVLVMAPISADIGVGGYFDVNAKLAFADSESGNDPTTGMDRDFLLSIGGITPGSMFGAKAALERNRDFWIYAWWKPLDLFMFKMGKIYEDSTWAGADIAGDGLHSNDFAVRPTENFAGNVLAAETGFFTPEMSASQSERALQASVYPIKGLSLNLGFPMTGGDPNTAENNYLYKLHAQIVYNINGVGEAAVSFINAPDGKNNFRNIFAQWKMPLGNTMRVEAGVNLGLNENVIEPLKIGLGFGWGNMDSGDTLLITSRAGVSIAMEDNQDTGLGFDLVASYDFTIFRLYVPVGLGVNIPSSGDTAISWSFTPYAAKYLGGPFVYGGFQIYSGAYSINGRQISTDGITWAIPVGLRWDF